MEKQKKSEKQEWLLFFYSIPARPPGGRTKIWRKLARIGAVRLKSAVYVLPYSQEHHEILQWLIAELSSLGGDGAMVRTETVEPFRPGELIALFNEKCIDLYGELSGRLSGLEQKLELIGKDMQIGRRADLITRMNTLQKELKRIKKIDFFGTNLGRDLDERMKNIKRAADRLSRKTHSGDSGADGHILQCRREDFQDRVWVTRKNPFVDRMASAWLIRKFIDDKPIFEFTEGDVLQKDPKKTTYDIKNGHFTHVGRLCTFEVLCESFGLTDHSVRRIGRIVHDIDLGDGKYGSQAAEGVELVLSGIRKASISDMEALERGMEIFEALYVSVVSA